ncbi:hepatic lectin-like [Crotalus tigris]|uniref:hepatic lectin-like n=1 Tax=Crotalus tigris TaxID=88082 RepID=UPI00192F4EA2|nr:hepatic lectin-like [Crotalus tigris]XP_039198418.1 hepatic lectin-like [Crotalus tigris]
MAPEEFPAKPPPDDVIYLNQSLLTKVPAKYWWIMICVTAGVLTVILTTSVQTYNALLAEDWSPYDGPMKKLRTTLSIGVRDEKIKHIENALKVSRLVERLPQLYKESEGGFAADKKKYQALFKRGSKTNDNWRLFGWNLYYISKANERKTWHDAEYFCKSRDSHLTSILNEEEQKYLSSKLNESAWIGLTDENVEGHWEWTDGSRLIRKYWAEGNPNRSVRDGEADEDCAAIKPSGSDLNWIDDDCQEFRRWVCKERLVAGSN